MECAIIHIPNSIGRPHWSKKDFGVLKKHVFYTRRASGNAEASIEEIRQMCIQTIRISDIAKQKAKMGHQITDELAMLDLKERESKMYKMLKSISSQLGLSNYRLLVSRYGERRYTEGALYSRYSDKGKHEFVIFMYPWTVNVRNIDTTRRRLQNLIESPTKSKKVRQEQERLKQSKLIHVAYKGISTSALERKYYDMHIFANEINETWGKIVKWQQYFFKSYKYAFFIPNVSSREELRERLMQLFEWAEKNIKD